MASVPKKATVEFERVSTDGPIEFATVFGGFLTKEDVDAYLQDAFVMMLDFATHYADAKAWAKWTLMMDDIAGRLFDYAVYRFIDEPPEGDKRLGTWSVPAEYRTAFIERIVVCLKGTVLPQFERISEELAAATKWKDETPEMIVLTFMNEQGWADKKFRLLKAWLKQLGKTDEKRYGGSRLAMHPELSAESQFLARHIFRPRFKSVVTDQHVSLATFIRSVSKKYAALQPIELTWRPLEDFYMEQS
jgi:hypothetical protein